MQDIPVASSALALNVMRLLPVVCASLSAQPLPNLLAYYAQTLPNWVHRIGMFFFWFAEIPAPFLFLCWGRTRMLATVFTVVRVTCS